MDGDLEKRNEKVFFPGVQLMLDERQIPAFGQIKFKVRIIS
jgi:hypothetical protein